MYYPINEEAARRGHDAYSMFDYHEGSTTAEYRARVDEAAEIARQQTEEHPEEAERLAGMLDRYARKLADYYNTDSRINAMCPSILIAGGSNFPVAKKERQNRAADANHEKWEEVQAIKEKMRTVGTGGIQSNDADAIGKLQRKLEGLEHDQEVMKAVNAYYRAHKTLNGCPDISENAAATFAADMQNNWRADPKPFESWALTNNNANIHRVRERIADLERAKAQPAKETETESGIRVEESPEDMRIRLIFPDKPDAQTRDLLKSWGFRWAPSVSAWQRQLNSNGKYAAKMVLQKLAE